MSPIYEALKNNIVERNKITLIFPINMVTKSRPLVRTMMLKTTSNHSVVLSRFPKVLCSKHKIVSKLRGRTSIDDSLISFSQVFFCLVHGEQPDRTVGHGVHVEDFRSKIYD